MSRYGVFLISLLLFVSVSYADYDISGVRTCNEYTLTCSSYDNDVVFDYITPVNETYTSDNIYLIPHPVYANTGTFPTVTDCNIRRKFTVYGASIRGYSNLYSYDEEYVRGVATCTNSGHSSSAIISYCNALSEVETDIDIIFYGSGDTTCSGDVYVTNEDICAEANAIDGATLYYTLNATGYTLLESIIEGVASTTETYDYEVGCSGKGYFQTLQITYKSATPDHLIFELNSTSDVCTSQINICTQYGEVVNDSLYYGFGCAEGETFVNQTCEGFYCNATCVGVATEPLLTVDVAPVISAETTCFDDVTQISTTLDCFMDELFIPFIQHVGLRLVIAIVVSGFVYLVILFFAELLGVKMF